MDKPEYDFAACRRLAAKVLLEGIDRASKGDAEARQFLTTERAQVFADINNIPQHKLENLSGRVDSVDMAAVRKKMEAEPANRPKLKRTSKLTPAQRSRDKRLASRILEQDPKTSGAELGRRLGRSQMYALKLKKQILGQ